MEVAAAEAVGVEGEVERTILLRWQRTGAGHRVNGLREIMQRQGVVAVAAVDEEGVEDVVAMEGAMGMSREGSKIKVGVKSSTLRQWPREKNP